MVGRGQADRDRRRQLGIGVADPGFRLDVNDRIRLRQGGSSSAGLWLFQDGTNADQAFVGMADDSRVASRATPAPTGV